MAEDGVATVGNKGFHRPPIIRPIKLKVPLWSLSHHHPDTVFATEGLCPMIEFDHVSRKYGPKLAVDRLSLTIQPGELFALLGPNGAGKTTSIKMLVGLLRPTSGTVRICGYDVVRETRQANRCVGLRAR